MKKNNVRTPHLKSTRRVVIKIGTSILTRNGKFDKKIISGFAVEAASLLKKGIEVCLVSSGAIGSGMVMMKKSQRPKAMEELQACAAIGQPYLMQCYQEAFKSKGFSTAQILLTWEDMAHESRFMNAKRTLEKIQKWGVVPIINENDTVATDEIKFGDNDKLSALISILLEADLLVILSDTDGLFESLKDGSLGNRIAVVENLNESVFANVKDTEKNFSVGGMRSKLNAVLMSVDSGVPVVLADGRQKNILNRIFDSEDTGTFFMPHKNRASSKQGWVEDFVGHIRNQKSR